MDACPRPSPAKEAPVCRAEFSPVIAPAYRRIVICQGNCLPLTLARRAGAMQPPAGGLVNERAFPPPGGFKQMTEGKGE